MNFFYFFFFFQAEDGIRDYKVTGVQTCALPISSVVVAAMVLPPRRMRTSPPGNGVPVALSATDPPMSPSAGGAVVNPAARSHAITSVGYRTFEFMRSP